MTDYSNLPDGTRVKEDLAKCESCKAFLVLYPPDNPQVRCYGNDSPPRVPPEMIILCGRPYCWECYPKAVAVLEADVKATEMTTRALYPNHPVEWCFGTAVSQARGHMAGLPPPPPAP